MFFVNTTILIGAVLTIIGVIILVVSQLLLRIWINKYNKEWLGGTNNDEVS